MLDYIFMGFSVFLVRGSQIFQICSGPAGLGRACRPRPGRTARAGPGRAGPARPGEGGDPPISQFLIENGSKFPKS